MTTLPQPQAVARRLDAELGELRLQAGNEVYRRLPRGFWMVSPQKKTNGLVEHLVSLSWGLPPAAELQGLAWGLMRADQEDSVGVRWSGRTNFRGQFWLHGLEKGEYVLRYVPSVRTAVDVDVLEAVGDPPARVMLLAASQQAEDDKLRERARQATDRLQPRQLDPVFLQELSAGKRPEHTFQWSGRKVWLRVSKGKPRVMLGGALSPPLARSPLLRLTLTGPHEELLAEALVGLVPDWEKGYHGEIDLDALAEGWREYEGPIHFSVQQQVIEGLSWHNHELLEQSLQATTQPYRERLEQAQQWLRDVFADWLPASAYGVPARREVMAVLPTDGSALAELVREALKGVVLNLIGSGPTNEYIMQWLRRELVGQATLSSADELRLLETAARELGHHFLHKAEESTVAEASAELPTTLVDTRANLDTSIKSPEAVKLLGKRLAELEQSDDAYERTQARLYRLARHAQQTEESISHLLGMTPEKVISELDMANKTVHRNPEGPGPGVQQ